MRLFTAIDLPPDILSRLDRLVAALRPEALIKWSPLDNLHITTKFIGEWPPDRLDEVARAIADVAPRAPFDIHIQNLGWFPDDRAPRILWAGVFDQGDLRTLAHDTEECLVSLGIPRETRAFSPHLTLARIKNPVPLRRLRQKVEEFRPTAIGAFRVSQFSLFRSDPGSNSSVYRKLRTFPLQAAMAAAGSQP